MNPTTNAPEQPKGKKISWVNESLVKSVTNRQRKDILSYKNALIYAESFQHPNRSQLYDLYKDIELDGFLVGIREKLHDAILNKGLQYKVKEQPVDEINKLINTAAFRAMCTEILLTRFWGITALEFIPGDKFQFTSLTRKHVKPKWRKITFDQYGTDGISYDDYWNIWVIGEAHDLGLYLICAFYVLLKKGVISNWADFIEMYGLPTTVMKYAAYDPQTKEELKSIINNAGSALQIVIPKEAEHEIHDSKNTASGDVQDKFRKMANEEMAVLILGATETSTSSAKSGGKTQSDTHRQEQKERVKSVMMYLANLLNEPIFKNILRNYGYPVSDAGAFEFDNEIDIEFMQAKIGVDTQLIKLGLPVDKEYLYKTYAIDKPDGQSDLLNPQQREPERQQGKKGNAKTAAPSQEKSDKPENKTLHRLYRTLSDFFGQAL